MLARTLGRTLGELERTCSAQEFGLWQAAWSLEPWGEFRTELAAGVVASTIANVHRSRDSEPFRPEQFMPYAARQASGDSSSPSSSRESEPASEPTGADFIKEFGAG